MLFAASLISCDDFLEPALHDDTVLESDQFYAVNFTNGSLYGSFYKVRAKILAEGEKCVIWAENDSGVDEKKAKDIADKYDKVIRPKIVGAFGMKDVKDAATQYQFDDILDYANSLAGKENKKLTILLLDIKDNFDGKDNLSYTAGYFYGDNFYKKGPIYQNGTLIGYSNGCDMIYVDTYPGLRLAPEETYATFAHELQHLINYTTTRYTGRPSMDTWIDEGLSSQAEYIYFGQDIENHYKHFNSSSTIAQGNNFFVWGNHVTKENPMAILDDYSTVYLFFRWLYLHASSELQSSIFLDIETSNLSDYRVITNAATKIDPAWSDWSTLLCSWLAANYYPTNSDYGYKDTHLKEKIKAHSIKPTPPTSINLYPGEGVYSGINGSFTLPSPSGNIRYAELNKGAEKALLTYNANTNKGAKEETGSLTGVPVSASVSSASNSRMVTEDEQAETRTGPYRIDARDYDSGRILGRNK